MLALSLGLLPAAIVFIGKIPQSMLIFAVVCWYFSGHFLARYFGCREVESVRLFSVGAVLSWAVAYVGFFVLWAWFSFRNFDLKLPPDIFPLPQFPKSQGVK